MTVVVNVGPILYAKRFDYTDKYYTDKYYKQLEDTFNRSQYRQKNPTALIPDETVFEYASGAYLRGVDPILINSEHTPLGKYIIGFAISVFHNARIAVIPFAFLTLIVLWLLGKKITGSNAIAFVPVILFSFEKLYLDQLRYVPLLDIIHLPFILLTLYFFLQEFDTELFLLTSLSLGTVAATKTVVPAILLVLCFSLTFIIEKKLHTFFRFILFLPVAGILFLVSYARTFLDGYTVYEFIGFQKWIFLYQKSKLIYPFSAWRLVFLNQWQAWWGDFSILKADDWSILWPVSTVLTLFFGFLLVKKLIKRTQATDVLFLWFFLYAAFLSIGTISSRFLLPYLPITYILGTLSLEWIIKRLRLLK